MSIEFAEHFDWLFLFPALLVGRDDGAWAIEFSWLFWSIALTGGEE